MLTGLLILFALFLGFAGIFSSSQATLGACLIGSACLLAILARIDQAEHNHKQAEKAAKARHDELLGLLRYIGELQNVPFDETAWRQQQFLAEPVEKKRR